MKKLALMTVICLALAACGGDKDSGNPIEDAKRGNNPSGMPTGMPTGMPPMMPGGMPTGLPGPDMLKTGGTIKLTDDMMERYVKALTALKGVDTPGEALLARYKFNVQEWAGISMTISRTMARTLGGTGEASEIDKHNMAVFERWKDRLQAAGKR